MSTRLSAATSVSKPFSFTSPSSSKLPTSLTPQSVDLDIVDRVRSLLNARNARSLSRTSHLSEEHLRTCVHRLDISRRSVLLESELHSRLNRTASVVLNRVSTCPKLVGSTRQRELVVVSMASTCSDKESERQSSLPTDMRMSNSTNGAESVPPVMSLYDRMIAAASLKRNEDTSMDGYFRPNIQHIPGSYRSEIVDKVEDQRQKQGQAEHLQESPILKDDGFVTIRGAPSISSLRSVKQSPSLTSGASRTSAYRHALLKPSATAGQSPDLGLPIQPVLTTKEVLPQNDVEDSHRHGHTANKSVATLTDLARASDRSTASRLDDRALRHKGYDKRLPIDRRFPLKESTTIAIDQKEHAS